MCDRTNTFVRQWRVLVKKKNGINSSVGTKKYRIHLELK